MGIETNMDTTNVGKDIFNTKTTRGHDRKNLYNMLTKEPIGSDNTIGSLKPKIGTVMPPPRLGTDTTHIFRHIGHQQSHMTII